MSCRDLCRNLGKVSEQHAKQLGRCGQKRTFDQRTCISNDAASQEITGRYSMHCIYDSWTDICRLITNALLYIANACICKCPRTS